MTGWIYTIPGLGSASMYAETEVNVEFNLLPGMAVRLWNLAPGQDTLAPLGLGEPSEDRRIDMIVGETMEVRESLLTQRRENSLGWSSALFLGCALG